MHNSAKKYISRPLIKWLGNLLRQVMRVTELGILGGIAHMIRLRVGTRGATYVLNPRHANHHLYYRLGSSDLDVFDQIFVDREYAPLCDMREVDLILDCGANVGYSSVYFLSQFPKCHIIAIEPDPGNFAMLKRNLSAYSSRTTLIRAGIWNQSVPLRIRTERYRDGREWTVQVEPCDSSRTPDIQGVSIASLLDESEFSRISILKMDIEGAETVVFKGNLDWLDRVDAIAIELHDDTSFGSASDAFHAAIHTRGFDEIYRHGELTICRRKKPNSGR